MNILLTDRAHADVEEDCQWLEENLSTTSAERWFDKLSAALRMIERNPDRFALANENAKLPIEIRQISFGAGFRVTHRIIYTIRPEMILVLRVRHLSQRDLTEKDF